MTETTAADHATQSTPPAGRAARGRFALGNPGGPGRPPKVAHIERELLACMASVLGPEIWMRVTQAMALKAMEGNVAAANWLSKTFMAGGLSRAAAAQAVGITAEAEMLVLGKQQHPEWARLLDERIAAEQNRETAPTAPAAMTTPKAPAAPAMAAQPAADGRVAEALAPCRDGRSGPHEPEAYRLAAVEAETAKTVETVETVSTAEAVKTAESVATSSVASVAAAPSRPLTVPPSEKVRGFRVTKGPRPPENRQKPSKRSAPPVVASPPTATCAAH